MIDIFESQEYVQANAMFRWLDHEVFNQYYYHILSFLESEPQRILDVGCGTGQFAINIAKKLPESQVFALDYSSKQINKMMEMAESKGVNNLTPILCPIEEYVSDLKFDIIICSEIIHLIDDLLGFAKKVTSMLKKGGVIAVRTPSAAQIYQREYYDYFPTCRYIDLLRCKSKELIETSFQLQGTFQTVSYVVDESRIITSKSLIQGTLMKQYSTLHFISQQEFMEGVQRMQSDYSKVDFCRHSFKMMLYLLKEGERNETQCGSGCAQTCLSI